MQYLFRAIFLVQKTEEEKRGEILVPHPPKYSENRKEDANTKPHNDVALDASPRCVCTHHITWSLQLNVKLRRQSGTKLAVKNAVCFCLQRGLKLSVFELHSLLTQPHSRLLRLFLPDMMSDITWPLQSESWETLVPLTFQRNHHPLL